METRICGSGVGVAEGGDESRSIDVVMEYAKAVADDILIRSSVGMRDPEAAPLGFAQAPPSTPAAPVTWSSLSGRFQIDTRYGVQVFVSFHFCASAYGMRPRDVARGASIC